jgi:Flp pilus assembly pilin Flp
MQTREQRTRLAAAEIDPALKRSDGAELTIGPSMYGYFSYASKGARTIHTNYIVTRYISLARVPQDREAEASETFLSKRTQYVSCLQGLTKFESTDSWGNQHLKYLCRAAGGQDIAEYAVMLAVILVLVVGTIRLVGGSANNVFSATASSIGG